MTSTKSDPRRKRKRGRPPKRGDTSTLELILRGARRNFARYGYAGTTGGAVAEEAGLTAGSLYYYFKSKAGLYEAVAQEAEASLREQFVVPVRAAVDAKATTLERMRAFVAVVAQLAEEDLDLYRLTLLAGLEAEQFPAVKAFVDATTSPLAELYANVVGAGASGRLAEDEYEIARFAEMVCLGIWHLAIRPGGVERLPIFVRAFDELLAGTLADAAGREDPSPPAEPPAPDDVADEGLREQILAAAVRRFARDGYGKTFTRDVAADVGVTTGALYYHFGSKPALYREIGERGARQMLGTLGEPRRPDGEHPQRARIEAFFGRMIAMSDERTDQMWFTLRLNLDAQKHEDVAEIQGEWIRKLEAVYRSVMGSRPELDDDGRDRNPAAVLLLGLSVSPFVVRNGPTELPLAIRGLWRLLPPG
jgi:AcrR family transcriptional regulator